MTQYVYGTSTTESGVARSDLLRATIYPDSDDTEALGNGTDNTYDRIELKYNRLGEEIERKDQLATVHAFDYDKLGRPTQDRVTAFGTGLDQTVKRIARSYEVRGMASSLTSYDNAAVGSGNALNEVKLTYNSFGQLTSEYQDHAAAVNTSTSPRVQYGWADGSSSSNHTRSTSITYPNARVITHDYGTGGGTDDVLNRITNIKESTTTYAGYTYLGAGTVVRIDYPQPQVRLDLWGGTSGTYAGIDRFGRVTDQKWSTFSGTMRDQFQYAYDRNSSRTSRDNTQTANLDELYAYDNLNRLTNMDRGTLSGGSIASPSREEDWTLDSTGNWSGFVTKTSGTTDLNQSRSHNKVNEIASISETVGSAWIDPVQNQAGNMITLPKPSDPTGSFTATYDAWNRLVELKEGANTVAKYKYDGRNWRTIKETYTSGTLSETRHFYYSNAWQVLEERTGTSANADRQFVWGLQYVDELVLRDRDTDVNSTLEERLYALQDANFNVTALVDTNGSVVERFSYNAYGQPIALEADFSVNSNGKSDYGWEACFAGYRWDTESGLYQVRNRYYHSLLGRWISRDPLEYADGPHAYAYVGNDPLNWLDPTGLLPGVPQADCVRDAIRVELDTPDWLLRFGKKFGVHQLKAKAHGEFKRCDECCTATGNSKTRTQYSISVGAIAIGEFGSPEFELWKIKARIGWYGRISGSGSVTASWSKCGESSGGGCISFSGEAGLIAEARVGNWAGGVRGGLNATVKLCAGCDSGGCRATVQLCGDLRARAWVKGKIWGWKAEYFHEWQWGGCTGALTLGSVN